MPQFITKSYHLVPNRAEVTVFALCEVSFGSVGDTLRKPYSDIHNQTNKYLSI